MDKRPYFLVVFLESELSLWSKLQEVRYWYVTRQTRKFIPWVARHLPSKLKYWVVIDGMVRVEPQNNPSDVMGIQILELWKEGVE